MHRRTTSVLALAVLLLGAYLLVWEHGDRLDREDLSRMRRALRLDPDRVEALAIDGPAGHTLCRRRGEDWQLAEPISARADTSRIRQILSLLRELPRGGIVLPDRRDRDAYAHYGLEPPQASLAVVQGASTNRLLIGRRSPLGDDVYVRKEGLDAVVRIPVSLLDLLPTSLDAMRSRSLLRGVPAAIDRLELRNASGYIQLARTPAGAWQILQPVATRADPVPIASLVRELLACTIVQFVQDGVTDFTPYGLDAPSALSAILDTEGGLGSQIIFFGDPLASSPGLVYARLQGENSVYAVPDAAAQALAIRLDDLRDRRIPGLTLPARIQGVRAEGDGAALEFHRDGALPGGWQIDRPRRVPADPAAITNLLAGWTGVRITAFEPPPAPSAASSLPPPPEPVFTRTLRIALADNPDPVLIHVGPAEATNACRIRIAGESATAIAEPAALLDFPLDAEPYQSLDVLSIPSANVLALDLGTPARTLSVRRDPVTGDWVQPPEGFDALLAALSPLRAAEWLPIPDGLDRTAPVSTLRITQTGRRTLSNTLLLYPDGIYLLRGHPAAFRLPPDSPVARWLTPSLPAAAEEEPAPAAQAPAAP